MKIKNKQLMRRSLLYLWIIFLAVIITYDLKVSAQQAEKEAILKLTKPEMEIIYQTLDDAPLAGQIRKPILQKIEMAYRSALAVQPQVKDTSKPKKN